MPQMETYVVVKSYCREVIRKLKTDEFWFRQDNPLPFLLCSKDMTFQIFQQ